MRVIYTTHTHRRDGSDMGLYDEIWPPIADRAGLMDDGPGIDIYPRVGFGPLPAVEIYRVSLGILAVSTAHVMTTDEFIRKSRVRELQQSAAE